MKKGLYVSDLSTSYLRLRQLLQAYSLMLLKENEDQQKDDIRFVIIDNPETPAAPLVSRYRSMYPQASILVVSAKKDEGDMLEALENGADDYQVKPCSDREVATRIRVIVKRREELKHHPFRPSAAAIRLEAASRVLQWEGIRIPLTKVECKLLELLLTNQKITSRNEINQHIWDGKIEVSSKAIDVHIFNLRKKLQQATGGRLSIKTITNKGFYLSTNIKQ